MQTSIWKKFLFYNAVLAIMLASSISASAANENPDHIKIPGFDLTIANEYAASGMRMARSTEPIIPINLESATDIYDTTIDDVATEADYPNTDTTEQVEEVSTVVENMAVMQIEELIAIEQIPERRVIITLKDPRGIQEWRNAIKDFDEPEMSRLESGMRAVAIAEIDSGTIYHEYQNINSFSAIVTDQEFKQLSHNPLVKSIEDDGKMHAFLADSTIIVNSTRTNRLMISGQNLTGDGQTICILDTGADYTHESLGGCSAIYNESNSTSKISLTSSSYPTNYTDAGSTTFIGNVTVNNSDAIQVFFTDMDIEEGDYLLFYDHNDRLVYWFNGIDSSFWSVIVQGDTIQIWLETNGSRSGRGFNITQVNAIYHNSSCSKVIGGHDFVNGDTDPMDDNGHGTHVAGIAAANGTMQGVAPGAKIIAMKVLDNTGSGYDSDILAAIDDCISHAAEWNVSVISMSLGSGQYATSAACDSALGSFKSIIDDAVSAGISVVAASGNGEAGTATLGVTAPACISSAIRIAASPKSDNSISTYAFRRATYNDILVAPGDTIISTKLGGGNESKDGTSMATPHAAGAFAVLKQFLDITNRSKTPSEIRQIFNDSGKLIYDSVSSKYYRRIDLYAAVDNVSEVIIDNITINSPIDGHYYNTTNITINITSNAEAISYSYSNSSNITYTQIINVTFNQTNASSPISLNVYANNTFGNRENASSSFWVDLTMPIAQFNISNSTIYVGQPLLLDARASTDEHAIANYSWNLGDGDSELKNSSDVFQKTYFGNGSFTLNLTAIDRAGNRNSSSLIVNVSNAMINDSSQLEINYSNNMTVINLSGNPLGYAIANISAEGNLSIQVIAVYGNSSPQSGVDATTELETIVKYMEINLSNSSWNQEGNQATVTFYIYNQTLEELGLSPSELTTYIHRDGTWTELATTVVDSSVDPLIFSFTTDHFTLFSIGKELTPIPPGGGSSSGGGGGGGGVVKAAKCTAYWQCTEWENCINGRRLRTCNDLNRCNDTFSMPETLEYCSRFNATVEMPKKNTSSDNITIIQNATANAEINETPVDITNSETENDRNSAKSFFMIIVVAVVSILLYILIHSVYAAHRMNSKNSNK